LEPSVFNAPRGIKTGDRRGVRQFPFVEKFGERPVCPIFELLEFTDPNHPARRHQSKKLI